MEKQEQAEKTSPKKKGVIWIIVLLVLIGALAFTAVRLLQPEFRYMKARTLLSEEQYEEAEAIFEDLNGLFDSAELAKLCRYNRAATLFNQGQYEEASVLFEWLGDYKDSQKALEESHRMLKKQTYETAVALREAGDYDRAVELFETLAKQAYKDAAE